MSITAPSKRRTIHKFHWDNAVTHTKMESQIAKKMLEFAEEDKLITVNFNALWIGVEESE